MDTNDIIRSQMVEAWRDVRSCFSTIWQVAALCLAIVGVTLNVVVAGRYESLPVFQTWMGWTVLFFTSIIVAIALQMMSWFLSVISTRSDFIQQVEAKYQIDGVDIYANLIPDEHTNKETLGFGVILFYEGRVLPRTLFLFFYTLASALLLAMYIQLIFLYSSDLSLIVLIGVPTVLFINVIRLMRNNAKLPASFDEIVSKRN